ncbi:MAG: acyltransferase [Caldilineaceae bacterium]|nr:acyltransferase [Caldilineaceae bacterium]
MIKKLLGINELALLGMLLFHSAGWGFIAMFAWANRYLAVTVPDYSQMGSVSYYALRVIEQLPIFAIPAFLFVSGYFIAVATGRSRTTISWSIIAARTKSLLIPYVLWSVLLWGKLFIEGRTLSVAGYAEALLTGRTNPAYYYVPLLISLYLISPLLVHWAKTRWIALLVGSALIQLTVQLLYYPALLGINIGVLEPLVDVVPKWFFPARIFWFAFGIVAGFHLAEFRQPLHRFRWHLLALTVLLFVAGVIEWEKIIELSGQTWLAHRETLIDTALSLTVILCFLAFDTLRLPFSGMLGDLNGKTYGIYLIHSPVMEVVARVIYRFAPALLGYQIVLQPLLFFAGLGVPLLLMALVSRSPWRGYYRYVFG